MIVTHDIKVINKMRFLGNFTVEYLLFAVFCFHFAISRAEISKIGLSDQDGPILRKFQIHDNMIILTKDSRALGAKYINETEVLSLRECLMWCWENTYCNVAVFEEQTKKSCFLFDCGSPADFRCKFMHHKFFTSSILKSTEHSYDLKHWGKDVKENLKIDSVKVMTTEVPTTAAVASSEPALNLPVTISFAVEPSKKTSKCRHYQFQCLNSSECIAIYNVCDGIPQCPDGSDESHDLHCPNSKNSHSSDLRSFSVDSTYQTVASVLKEKSQALEKNQFKELHQPTENQDERQFVHSSNLENEKSPPLKDMKDMVGWHQDNVDYDHPADGSDRMHSSFAHKHSTFLAANNGQYPNKWPNDYDRYNQPSTSLDQQYGPYEQRLDEPKSQYPDYERTVYDTYHPEDNSLWVDQDRLRNGIYLNDFPQVQSPNRQVMYQNQRNLYNSHPIPTKLDNPSQYGSIDKVLAKPTHHLRESVPQQLIPEEESFPVRQSNRPRVWPSEDMPRTDYRMYPKVRGPIPEQAEQPQISDGEKAVPENLSNQLLTFLPGKSVHMYEPIAEVPMYTTPASIEKKPALSTMKPAAETTSMPSPTEKIKAKVTELKASIVTSARLYEAQSIRTHESNSAIVALSLGLIVTGLLVLLVACHLRTLKRRSSRRGRPLAHDADYLVNGLYL